MSSTPTIIFDHTKGAVTLVGSDPKGNAKLAELLAAQRGAVTTAGAPKPA